MEENVTMNSCGNRPVDAQNVSWSLKIKATCYVSHKKRYKKLLDYEHYIKSRVCVWDYLFQVLNYNQWATT